jgi:TusA-related sulfurtransferase
MQKEELEMSDIVTVNASGLSCPQPVMETKKVLDKTSAGKVEVLVDTATSRDNVSRFAENKGWKATKEERPGGYRVLLEK